MTQHLSQKLLLLAALIAIAAGQRCKVPVPFTTRLVGKVFTKFDNCNRPSTSSEIRVNAKTFVLNPLLFNRFPPPVCVERYVFYIRRDGKDPSVAHFPALEFKPENPSNLTIENLIRFCEKEHQTVREYFPVGKTRKKFKESVRTMIKATTEIRDFGCQKNEGGYYEQVPGRAFVNVDLDGIVTYLLGVAYQYNFCASK